MNLMKLDIQLFAEGKVIIDVEADTKSFDAQIESLKKQLEIIDKQLSDPKEYGLSKDDIANLTVRAEKLNNQLTGLNAQKRKLEEAPTGFQKWLQNSGKEIEKNINKVKRWALAIFGIRSAYMAIRSAMSQITSEDSQIATDIEYMKWVLAQTLKPVVEWLVRALYTVLALINAISQSIFGINILAGKSAEDFKNMKKNAGGISGALKEAKKQLAGFDEMNVLQDTSSSGGAGGGFNMDDWEMPNMNEFNKNVKEAKNEWMGFGEEMRQSIEEMPFEIWLKAFGAWGVAVRGVTEFVYGLWEIVTGLVQFTKGALELIVGLTTNDTEKIKTAVFDMGDGIWKICDGLIHGILGLVQTVIGTIMGLLWEFLGSIIKINVEAWNWFTDGINKGIKFAQDKLSGFVNSLRNISNTITQIFGIFGTKVGEAVGNGFKGVINSVLSYIEWSLNSHINALNALIKTVNKISPVKLSTVSTLRLPRLARGGIVNNPGQGIMMGNYIAGEKGAEAVLPLTDGTLQKLANMMPITVHVTNTMNGRVLSREIQRVQNENNFAFNG